ncbi:MAG: leucine-rich repeat protein [bacterium]
MTNNVVPDMNAALTAINNDVANNDVLTTMASLLPTNNVITNDQERLTYLGELINTNYTFVVPQTAYEPWPNQVLAAYQVLNNSDGCNYLIVQQAGAIPWNYNGTLENAPDYVVYAKNTQDGRYSLAYDTGNIKGLFQADTSGNPLNYLRSPLPLGGLTDISQADGIILARTLTTGGGDEQELYLLDAQHYNALGDPDQYLRFGGTTNGPLVQVKDVVDGTSFPFTAGSKALDNAAFLSIFYDTHINIAGVATNGSVYYTPGDAGDLPAMFSLDNGDVLDISGLSGLLEKTIRICGNATIIGGGSSHTITNLKIESYGGSLTISNLFLSSNSNIIYNVNDLVLVATGSNSLQSTLVTPVASSSAVIGGGGGNITLTGPGALVVETNSTTMPAILSSGGSIIVNGASNLSVSAQGATSIYNGYPNDGVTQGNLFIVDSKVTSHVGVESDNEFTSSMVTLGNSVLDMSHGTINPNIVSPCTWLGAIRGVSQVSVKTDSATYSGTGANIYLRIEGTTGATKYYNIKTLAGGDGDFQDGKTAEFRMSYSITNTVRGYFQGLGVIQFIQLYEDNSGSDPDWNCDWVNIAPNVIGDVPTAYQFAVEHNFNGASDVRTVSAVEQINPYGYTINPDHATVTFTGYAGTNGVVIIPSSIHGYAVTAIATNTFNENTNLTHVTIPASVTNIEATAFWGCPNLTAVYFQGSPPSLGTSAFGYDHDPLTIYFLPGTGLPGTTGWGATFGGVPTALWVPFTFTTNSDNTVTITGYTGPGGAAVIPSTLNGHPVTSIGSEAFNSNYGGPSTNGLTSISIPGSVTNIGQWAFYNCYGLMGVYFQGLPPNLIYNNGSPFSGDALATVYYLPENAGAWGATFGGLPTALWTPFYYTINPDNTVAITGYSGLGGSVVVPGLIEGLPVTSLGSNAFYACADITCISIPNSVTNVGGDAFFGCTNLAGVYFQGNAPGQVGANVFNGDTGATVFRFAGTTNWPAVPGAWHGRPTALWLDVINGTDDGSYTNLQQVAIAANVPAAGAFFAQWTGATQYLASVTSASTTVNMPLQPVTLTATYYYAPFITTQPVGQSVFNGFTANFSVTATGTAPLAYQWYFGSNAISGATATNYTVSGATSNNAGEYSVEVTNLYDSATSSVAVLAVLYPPVITTSPTSQVVAAGATVSLSVSTTGQAPLSFQWFKNGGMITGAINSALTMASAGVPDSGVYYVVVTNEYGLKISLPATVTVGAPQLLAWGYNYYGQLGDGNTNNSTLPVSVASNVVAATAGEDHSLFVKTDGTLWGMGYNADGELGDGTTNNSTLPLSVASNVVVAAGGAWHSLYLKVDGTLWAMGQNDFGQLGDGTTFSRSNAVVITNNVVAVAAGATHSVFLKGDGTLWTMGQNEYGQLGNGTTAEAHWPVSVASNVVTLAAGVWHSMFVKADGTLWVMGRNNAGQLGDGTTGQSDTPECVASNVAAVAAGGFHSLYLKGDGTLWAMGDNDCGQLGVGTIGGQSDRPVSVASNVTTVAAGLDHSLFLKQGGTLWGMGDNEYGQLGDIATTQWSSPVPVSGMSLANVISGCNAGHSLAVGLLLEKTTFTLNIQSAHGTANPSAGAYTNIAGAILTNTVNSPIEQNTTQFVCTGWAMTGNAPVSGQTNRLVMTLTNNAELTWQWATNYWLAAAHGTNGTVNTDPCWQASCATTQITATADQYFHFANWIGDATGSSNPLALLMDAPKSVTANFAANMTTNQPTPEWWLAQYGITNNFEQAVLDDPDHDGMVTSSEYLAGTDPTNRNSVLILSGVLPEFAGEGMVVSWQGVEGKFYSLARGSNLTDVTPFGHLVSTNMPGLFPMNTETDKTAVGTGPWFYRINLE